MNRTLAAVAVLWALFVSTAAESARIDGLHPEASEIFERISTGAANGILGGDVSPVLVSSAGPNAILLEMVRPGRDSESFLLVRPARGRNEDSPRFFTVVPLRGSSSDTTRRVGRALEELFPQNPWADPPSPPPDVWQPGGFRAFVGTLFLWLSMFAGALYLIVARFRPFPPLTTGWKS